MRSTHSDVDKDLPSVIDIEMFQGVRVLTREHDIRLGFTKGNSGTERTLALKLHYSHSSGVGRITTHEGHSRGID